MPVSWCEDFSFPLGDIFTRLRIVGKEKTQGALTDEVTNMTAIFKEHEECQRPRTILIEGDPGMGKTTYCQKLAYDWATKQDEWDPSFRKIEVLLFLRCHEMKSNIWEAIDDQILPGEIENKDKECFFKFICEKQSRVLLVLDGLDEADPSNLKMFSNLVESRDLSGCYIVLTSRHEAGRKVRRFCDTLWEIVGFTKEDAEDFIRKYFKNIKKEHLAEKLIAKIWSSNKELHGSKISDELKDSDQTKGSNKSEYSDETKGLDESGLLDEIEGSDESESSYETEGLEKSDSPDETEGLQKSEHSDETEGFDGFEFLDVSAEVSDDSEHSDETEGLDDSEHLDETEGTAESENSNETEGLEESDGPGETKGLENLNIWMKLKVWMNLNSWMKLKARMNLKTLMKLKA